jgi:hypothetical protein
LGLIGQVDDRPPVGLLPEDGDFDAARGLYDDLTGRKDRVDDVQGNRSRQFTTLPHFKPRARI